MALARHCHAALGCSGEPFTKVCRLRPGSCQRPDERARAAVAFVAVRPLFNSGANPARGLKDCNVLLAPDCLSPTNAAFSLASIACRTLS